MRMPSVRIIKGQMSNKVGYVSLIFPSARSQAKKGRIPYLKLMQELLLDPGRSLGRWSVEGHEQVVVQINNLREACHILLKTLGHLWRPPVRRNEPHTHIIDQGDAFPQVQLGALDHAHQEIGRGN